LPVKVLIPSGAGSPGFGGILECLKELDGIQVFAGDMNPNSYGKFLADGFFEVPPPEDPHYLESVIQNAVKFGCNVILPITTRELPILSAADKVLAEKGIAIVISPPGAMDKANNKGRMYCFLHQCRLPCVNFDIVNSKVAFFEAVKRLQKNGKKIVMKPAVGNGSRGFRIIVPEEEIRSIYFQNKAGAVETTMSALHAELPDQFPGEIVVSDYLPGIEYSVDLLADRGKVLVSTIRVREKTVSGISVKGTFVEDAEIEKQCRILTDNLDLHGPLGMQFKRDEDGVAKLLEINPRLQGAVSTCRFAGVNYPVLAVKLAIGDELNIPESRPRGAFHRYWKDIQA